jgi:S1-C subfamily serine protease
MKLKILYIIGFASLMACQNQQNNTEVVQKNEVKPDIEEILEKPQDPDKFESTYTTKVTTAISSNNFVSIDKLQDDKIKNIEENSNVTIKPEVGTEMNGNHIYYYMKERTFMTAQSYLCTQCPNTHLSHATAFVIHEDGILLTNYHVIDKKEEMNSSAIFVSDYKGNIYNVIEILAASQSNDLAIIKIDTKGKKLKYIPFANEELLGEDIYLMGHPFGQNYYMSKGIIARKYINERDNEPRLAVTAEFGQGSSGGPFVNTKGELVAMVAGTYSNYTMNSKEHGYLQMITKEVIPVSSIWKYVAKE